MPQGRRLTAAGASLRPARALPKWDCINRRQRNRAKQSLAYPARPVLTSRSRTGPAPEPRLWPTASVGPCRDGLVGGGNRIRTIGPALVKGLSVVADERCRTAKLDGIIKHRSSRETTMVGRGASLDGRLFLGGTDGSNPFPSSGEPPSHVRLAFPRLRGSRYNDRGTASSPRTGETSMARTLRAAVVLGVGIWLGRSLAAAGNPCQRQSRKRWAYRHRVRQRSTRWRRLVPDKQSRRSTGSQARPSHKRMAGAGSADTAEPGSRRQDRARDGASVQLGTNPPSTL
jgi:hypothetical protein